MDEALYGDRSGFDRCQSVIDFLDPRRVSVVDSTGVTRLKSGMVSKSVRKPLILGNNLNAQNQEKNEVCYFPKLTNTFIFINGTKSMKCGEAALVRGTVCETIANLSNLRRAPRVTGGKSG